MTSFCYVITILNQLLTVSSNNRLSSNSWMIIIGFDKFYFLIDILTFYCRNEIVQEMTSGVWITVVNAFQGNSFVTVPSYALTAVTKILLCVK